ncbi:hypothetical protein HXX76_001110 [Chlamydomonas incerta]|uniref:phytol kinase n=1 Tax=Chlamydomonas incerta TaxID=51695 RepID=A0A836B196_CHLIN|nr:hypothetical protein HXX76_001110 [Chlamydomonas incerta]|eukprot:KAG2444354.1 hypothetical protein HXX76_001110 [Chlamydomonas incerta]
MALLEQSPENSAAVLAVLGWAAREATSVAQAQQQPQQPASRAGARARASDEELLPALLQLVSAALAPLTLLGQVELHNAELGHAVCHSQLPQALVRLLAALCPPGFRCCGSAGGGGSGGRGSAVGGSGVSGAGLEARLDVVVGIAIFSAGMWGMQQRDPELAACMTHSRLVESVAVALLRAQVAECGRQQPRRSSSSSSSGAGAGPWTAPAGSGGSSGSGGSGGSGGSCYGAWLRGSKRGKQLWTALRVMLHNVATVAAPGMPPRTWCATTLLSRVALTLPHCRVALAGPAIQLLLGRMLLAETNRCLAEAEAAGAGGSAAGSSRGAGGAAGTAAGLHQQRWRALPECLRAGVLPLPRTRAGLLLDVVETAGIVWSFLVSGPRLPRLGQQPPEGLFGGHPAKEAVCKVMGGVAAPEEEEAVAAAEAQLPPLHPPSYTAVQVYELTHAALTAALAHAPAEAECLSAPSLLARLVMELPPRQAAARLPGLWRTLSCALPRLACGGADDGAAFQGPFWKRFGICRSESTWSFLSYLGLLLQLQLPPGSAASAHQSVGPAAAAGPAAATVAAGATGPPAAPSGAAAPGPGPDFSMRCALRAGLLPAIEALLRRLLSRTAAVTLAGHQQAARFMDAAMQAAHTVDVVLRTSGVWPAVLAHGPPQQVASLMRTMGKALAVVGDTFHALRQRPQLLQPATQMLSAIRGSAKGQRYLFDALCALLEQASCMTDGVLTVHGLQATGAVVCRGGGWHHIARRLPVNDRLGPAGFALRTHWLEQVGGCPFADTAAAHQQRVLADWAVRLWMPQIIRQTDRDGPTHVCSMFSMGLLLRTACRVLWPALREDLIASDAAAAAEAEAVTPPCDAAANAAAWQRFLLHDLDALGLTERVLARTAASTEPVPAIRRFWALLGLTIISVSEVGGGPEACDAPAAASISVVPVPLPAGAAAERNSNIRRQLLQHVHRISHSMGGDWPATVEGVQLSLPSAAAGGAAASSAAPAASLPLTLLSVQDLLLQQLRAELGSPYLLIGGSVPPAPDVEQVAALIGSASLALCGNPACRSLEGDSEAGLMAAPAPAGRQQGGRGCGGDRIKTCTRCHAVRYCCGACQLQHWTTGGHKEACVGAAGVSDSAGGGQTAGREQV